MGSASNAAVSPGRALNWRSCGFRSLQQYQQRQTLPPHRRTMSTTTTMCPSLTADGWKRAEEKRQGPGRLRQRKRAQTMPDALFGPYVSFFLFFMFLFN